MNQTRIRQKYFALIMAEFPDGEIIEGEVARDGLIFVFNREDIEHRLNELYPNRDEYGWYFNSSESL